MSAWFSWPTFRRLQPGDWAQRDGCSSCLWPQEMETQENKPKAICSPQDLNASDHPDTHRRPTGSRRLSLERGPMWGARGEPAYDPKASSSSTTCAMRVLG